MVGKVGVKYSNTVYTKMRVEVIVGGLRKYNKCQMVQYVTQIHVRE